MLNSGELSMLFCSRNRFPESSKILSENYTLSNHEILLNRAREKATAWPDNVQDFSGFGGVCYLQK